MCVRARFMVFSVALPSGNNIPHERPARPHRFWRFQGLQVCDRGRTLQVWSWEQSRNVLACEAAYLVLEFFDI